MTAVFEELGFWQKRTLCRKLDKRELGAGEAIMTQGDPGTEFMVLLDGEASIEVDGQSVCTIGHGAFFGELALLPHISKSGGRRVASVVAASDVKVAVCGQETFDHLIDAYPRVGGRILAQAWSLTGV